MSRCFTFRLASHDRKNRKSLVVFSEKMVALDAIGRAIKADVTENMTPENVYLISANAAQHTIDEIEKDRAFCSEFMSFVGDVKTKLIIVHLDKTGFLHTGNNPLHPEIVKSILHQGMLCLFRKHRGLLVSNSSYHFVKPSGAHCDSFIRAANLLVSSSEVSFLALALLAYLKPGIKRIYVDTSSIAFLVSIALQLYARFDYGTPSIESFESYAALNSPYDFVVDESSLVFISATMSGSLATKLIEEKNFQKDSVITLFHVNLPASQAGVFNVSEALTSSPLSVKHTDCDLCKRGSRIVHIDGEQFLPESPKHELLVIRKADFSLAREKLFEKYAATGALQWHVVSDTTADVAEHFFIDTTVAIQAASEKFLENFEKMARRYISRNVTHVICLEDECSKDLLSRLNPYLADEGTAPKMKFVEPREIDDLDLEHSGSVLVVAAAITSGRKLLSISRKLRKLNSMSSILYFVAFSKLPSQDAQEQLSKDLRLGGNELIVLERCFLPRVKEYTKTAWDWEREVLCPFIAEDPMGVPDKPLPPQLQSRYEQITGQQTTADGLFLPDPAGSVLKLRRTFAFWSDLGFDEIRLQSATQADVYWTIQVILHDLRNSNNSQSLATPYHTTLVSPTNFDRFNDGLVQACLLRSALPVELDYRVDDLYSRQMADVIISIFKDWRTDQGEASLEFLMALWTGRLKLSEPHLDEVKACKCDSMPDDMTFIFDRLSEG